jgi:RimJ/RimL family protein N-acetyltransferase
MNHAEAVAASLGITAIRVDTNIENQATQRLFPSLGYRFAGEISLAIRPGQRFLCYEKRIVQGS